MSKSTKRNYKYDDDDYYEAHDLNREPHSRLREKRLRAAMKSKNIDALYKLTEEEY
jgi:hypothetical protein